MGKTQNRHFSGNKNARKYTFFYSIIMIIYIIMTIIIAGVLGASSEADVGLADLRHGLDGSPAALRLCAE